MSGQGNLGPAWSWAEAHTRYTRARAIDAALQAAIAILSFAAIAMVSSEGALHRWGFVVGLASQPFWIAATWRSRQWGILILAIFYCGAWAQGILNRF